MVYKVFLTDDAARDLEELYDHIESHDAPEKADYVIDNIEEVFSSLPEYPERGAYPKELLAAGLHDYREIYFKPYRIIYRTVGKYVYVMVIADGRRDMQELLLRRMLQT